MAATGGQRSSGSSSGGSGRASSAEKTSPVPHTRIEDEKMIEKEYEMGRKLGQGSFGIVREVIHRQKRETWACKQVNKEKAGSSAIKLLEREVAILKRVHHQHIIRLKEVFETSKKMYLVMELCEGGELADVLKERGTFSETETRTIMARLTSAIAYLHKNDMVHRDLKLENILLSNNPRDTSDHLYIKVTDFGLSVVKGGVSHENMMMDFCGTPMYMAPEIIENKTYSEKCDVWAMGVIFYILLCGQPPFVSKDEQKLYDIIKSADISKHFEQDKVWHGISKEAKDCVCRMLTVDPAHRLTAHEVLDHPWITGKAASEDRPRNVLEMMREWKNELSEDAGDDVNGEDCPVDDGGGGGGHRNGAGPCRSTQALESEQEAESIQNNNNNNKPTPRKYTPRNSAESPPTMPKTANSTRLTVTGHVPRCKSKSPTDKDGSGRPARATSTGTPAAQSGTAAVSRPATRTANGPAKATPRTLKKR